jgi:peptide/nickel transport system substrate-binding protein
MLRMRMDGTIVPDIAKDVQLADDATSMTVFLRKGMKWSDGAPFTADDVLFMFEDMHMNDEVQTWGFRPFITGVTKLDDFAVRFNFDGPHPEYYLNMVEWRGSGLVSFHPKHFLQKWHIKYNTEANELAKEEGYDDWTEAFRAHYWWVPLGDINKPTTQPWKFTQFTTTNKVYERNPYYHMVDTAGNQLPYIDRVVTEIVDPEVYNLKILSGEADVAFANTNLANFTLYQKNAEAGGYRIVSIPGINGSEVGYAINQNHSDPAMRTLFQDIRFRQAMSIAINRDEINEVVFFGIGIPRQATIIPTTRYYKPEWGETHPYARYSPDEANRLLDEIGLTDRDRDGFRLRPDGKTVLLTIEAAVGGEADVPTPVQELVKEYWQAVGLKTQIKSMDAALYGQRGQTGDHDIRSYTVSNTGEFYAYVSQAFVWSPISHGGSWGREWGIWLQANEDVEKGRKTLADFEGGKLPGEEPTREIKDLWDLIYNQFSNAEFGSQQYFEAAEKLYDYHAEKIYIIGTVGLIPTLYIAKKNIGNVPTQYPPHAEVDLNLNNYASQLFFK